MKYLILIFVVILSVQTYSHSNNETLSLVCYIKNFKYKNQYLYSSNQYDAFDNFKRKVFTNELIHVDDLDDIKWILIPIQTTHDQYTIRSFSNVDEYLCGSHTHLYVFKQRRRVNLIKLNKDDHRIRNETKCRWRIDLLNDKTKLNPSNNHSNSYFTIWNVYYDEPLYVASFLFKQFQSNNIRNVYTWYSAPNSDQFIWKIECEDML